MCCIATDRYLAILLIYENSNHLKSWDEFPVCRMQTEQMAKQMVYKITLQKSAREAACLHALVLVGLMSVLMGHKPGSSHTNS